MTPWTVAHQVPLVLEFLRQGYWSRLPFTTSGDLPNPGIKPVSLTSLSFLPLQPWLCVHAQVCLTLWTGAHQAPLSTGFSRQEYWSGLLYLSPGDLPDSGIKPVSLALAGEFFTAEPPEKPKNTGVGSLSLLQRMFLTQELNQGLLHCRWILSLPTELSGKPLTSLIII